MEREVEGLTGLLAARPDALAAAVVLDLLLGDPVYRFHPVRLIGASLTAIETGLRSLGANGYGGGIALFVILASIWIFIAAFLQVGFTALGPWPGWLFHVFIVYSLLALGDLVRAVWRVERALERQDLAAARFAISPLVGRDTDRMDDGACRRAAIESLSENLPDGFISAIFWYVLLGLPGIVVFKVVSTMDSMVGYKRPRYLRFGWCGARLDDVMNFVPARLTWLLIAASALVVPGGSPAKALAFGYRQARLLPSPNSGWPEAATAGAIQRRLLGPIWKDGALVTDIWLGDPNDPPVATHSDMKRAIAVNVIAGLIAAVLAVLLLIRLA
jgi:adenosylcobinamide-phosphate synthase